MPAGQYSLRRLQVGAESVNGTSVPATWKLSGVGIFTPQRGRYYPDYPHGVRVRQSAGGMDLWQAGMLTFNGDNTYQEMLYPLSSSFGAGAPTTTLGATTWVFTPSMTADPAPVSFTSEYVVSDGVTPNVYAGKGTFGLTKTFSLDMNFNQKCGLTWNAITQAETSGITPTPALTLMTGRETLSANNGLWTIDDTWAGLGGSSKLGTVRTAKIDVTSGLDADYTQDGRANQDWGQYVFDQIKIHLQLVCEHNTIAAAEVAKWRSRALRFIRYKNVSGTGVGSGAAKLTEQIDMSLVYSKEPSFSNNGPVEIATLDFDLEYDPTSAKSVIFTLINGLGTFT